MINKNFIILLIGQSITMFGSAILRFALALYVLSTTGRSDYFAILLALSTIPLIIVTPLSGVLVDRVNKKALMVLIDLASAVIILLFAVFIQYTEPSLFVIGLIMILMAVISAIEQPNSQAVLPLVVTEDYIIKANGLVTSIGSLSGLIAPLLGGVMYSFFGLNALVIVTLISFVIAVIFECFITIPKTIDSTKFTLNDLKNDFKEGVHYITKENHFIYKITILAALLNLFMSPFILVGIPYLIKVVTEASDSLYGIAQAIIEFSMVIGAISVSIIGAKLAIKRIYKYILISLLGFIPVLLATLPFVLDNNKFISYLLLIFGTALISVVVMMISVYVIGLVQKDTPKQLLGKVMALLFTISQCVAPIGQILYGMLFEIFKNSSYIPIIVVVITTIIISLKARKDLANY